MKSFASRCAVAPLGASRAAVRVTNHEQGGVVLGGAAAGSAVGRGSGRILAILVGVGSAEGAGIGQHMDEQDGIRTADAMEHSRAGQAANWRSPNMLTLCTITPQRTSQEPGGPCRQVSRSADVGGRPQQVCGKACRQGEGSRRIVR